jgi:hypothetical protein
VIFDSGSQLAQIENSTFCESGLEQIVIPASVIVLNKSSLSRCVPLESVNFESGSGSEQIDELAF